MKTKLINLVIGGLGAGATEVVDNLAVITPDDVGSVGNLLIQIVIGLCTIIGIFKKRKE